MSGQYGRAAIEVVNNYKMGQDIKTEWYKAVRKETNSESSIKKPCPLCAFLGLCEEGLVKNIPKGNYLKPNNKNKAHALALYQLLKKNKTLSSGKLHKLYEKELGYSLNNNRQADVVVSLYKEELLKK